MVAVTKARGMEVAGAVDSHLVGEDVGKVCLSFSKFCFLPLSWNDNLSLSLCLIFLC